MVSARYLAEKYGGSLICAYCEAITKQMTDVMANCQQAFAKHAQEMQVGEHTYQRVLDLFKKNEQEQLEISKKEIRKLKLQINDALFEKTILLQELSILASRALVFSQDKSLVPDGDTFPAIQQTNFISTIARSLTTEAFKSPITLAQNIKEALKDYFASRHELCKAGRVSDGPAAPSDDINDFTSNEDLQQ